MGSNAVGASKFLGAFICIYLRYCKTVRINNKDKAVVDYSAIVLWFHEGVVQT